MKVLLTGVSAAFGMLSTGLGMPAWVLAIAALVVTVALVAEHRLRANERRAVSYEALRPARRHLHVVAEAA